MTRLLSGRLAALALPLLFVSSPAGAAELVWEGHFRSRARFFDSLSLSDTNTSAEGSSFWWDNRLRLQPGWLLSDKVSIHAQLDLLPYVSWGERAVLADAYVDDEDEALAWTQAVAPPVTEEGGATLQNIQVTRAWAELDTGIGRFRFGRVPVHWGSGLVWNAGNDPLSEYGDTSDRVQLTSRVGPVYVISGFEVPFEGYVNQRDDLSGVVGGVLYETESVALGTYNTFRWASDPEDETSFSAFIGDVWGWSRFGPAEIELELAAVVGGGDLDTGENDISVLSFGGVLSASMPIDRLRVGLDVGFAGGDQDETDDKLRVFTFDPDWNRTLLLFEEPLPTLEASSASSANEGRSYGAMVTSDGISNAMFLRPRVGWGFNDKLSADLSLFAAQRARVSEDDKANKGLGLEVDLDVRYEPFEFFSLSGTTGVLVPGRAFSQFEDDQLGGGFDQPAWGARLVGEAHF